MAAMRTTGPMKGDTARRIRKTAAQVAELHPETITADHLQDAAKVLEHGSLQGAKRHLDAAIELLTPQSLRRHGILDDEGHANAKQMMHEIHRHRLSIQDIEDTHATGIIGKRRARLKELGENPDDYDDEELRPAGEPIAASGGDGTAVELALPHWLREARDPGGKWMKVGGMSARLLHGKTAIGRTARGEVIGGNYDHTTKTIRPRHGSPIEVRHVMQPGKSVSVGAKPVYGTGFSNVTDLAAGYDNPYFSPHANPLTNWMNEARDPHTGKWISGPAEAHNVREHMEGQHGFGHSLGHLSDTELMQRHSLIHQEPQFRDLQGGHHHVVRGGGPEYARKREARDFMAAALTVPESMLPNLGWAGFGTGISNPYKGQAETYSSWAEVDSAIELSARTGMLAVTPAPRGRPGGPGLYHQKGMGHTPYLQQIVKALIEKRGMSSDKAYAIARGAIRKWMRGGGHVHPEVVAAAGRAEAGELAKQARAKASSHAAGWEQIDRLIELAMVAGGGTPTRKPKQGQRQRPQSSNWQGEQRVPKGQFGGGRFSKGGGGGQVKKRDPNAGHGMAGKTPGSRARLAKRAVLVKKATSLRSQIHALEAQLPHTSRGRKSKSSAPAKKGAAATSAKQARQAKQQATRAAATAKAGHSKQMSVTSIHAKIAALRAQLQAVMAQIRSL